MRVGCQLGNDTSYEYICMQKNVNNSDWYDKTQKLRNNRIYVAIHHTSDISLVFTNICSIIWI